jgi:hypothetical protein
MVYEIAAVLGRLGGGLTLGHPGIEPLEPAHQGGC